MIIFTTLLETKQLLMQIRQNEVHTFYEFNLSSPIEYGINLTALIPNEEVIHKELIDGTMDTPEFDIAYHQFIMQNHLQFMTFMSMILPLYNDPCACVLVYIRHSPVRDVVLESLVKLIQQRYGYLPYLINEIEDIYYIKDDSSFGVRGIVNVQSDSERAAYEGFYGPIVVPPEEGLNNGIYPVE